jgi:excisionase family DNA binding protein
MSQDQQDFCTTQEVARLLGISVSSVQKLVETGDLTAWKTQGGHRRIALQSVIRYRDANRRAAPSEKDVVQASLLIVEDDPMQRALYEGKFRSWNLPLDVRFCDNGYQALMEIGAAPPDILLLDIVMSGIDGYEVMDTVLARSVLRHISILIVSSASPKEILERGGLPSGVTFFRKPIVVDQLLGYLQACIAYKQRAAK